MKHDPIKVIACKEVMVTRCYNECPFFGLDGGPGPVMYCDHPTLRGKGMEAQFIISHPDCDTGFPTDCPLLKGLHEA